MNSKIKELYKSYETALIVTAIVVSLFIGRASNDVVKLDFGKTASSEVVPLTYSEISTATNEKGEIIILEKQSAGYKVKFVLSDTVAKGISNINLTQRYPNKL